MSEKRSILIGAATLAAFLGAVVFGFNALRGNPLTERATVEAAFDDVGGLTVGDDVRMSSVRVGYVEELTIRDGHALAILKLDDKDMAVHADAKAAVIDRSALGQKFVNLDPGTKAAGPLTEAISIENTQEAQDINQLFDTFDEPTRAGASTSLTELGGGMDGHAQDMRDVVEAAPELLGDTGKVSEVLVQNDGDALVRMLDSTDTLVSRFEGREQDVSELVEQFGQTLDALGVDQGDPMRQTITEAPETLESASSALTALREPLKDTGTAMTTLRPGGTALGEATPDLRGFLREGVKPLRKLPGVNEEAEPAVESLTNLVADARPLVRQLVATGDNAAEPLAIMKGYDDELVRYFTFGSETLNNPVKPGSDDVGMYARILVMPSEESIGGVPSLTVDRDPYAKPGTTDRGN